MSASQMLPKSVLFAYALPSVPLAALTLPLYIIVPTFYTETLGLSLAAVGFALLVVRIFDAFNDPLIGWAADRMRLPMGRRRSLFLFSLPITALAAYMLFNPPTDATAAYLTLWALVLTLGYTMTALPYASWGAELETGYDARSRLVGYRETFTLVGTLVATAVPFTIGLDSAQGLHGLAILAYSVPLALLVFGVICFLRVPEPAEYSRQRVALLAGLGFMWRNHPFRRLIVAYLINGLANGIPATLFLYFVSDRLGVPEMRGPLLLVYFVAGGAGIPLAVWAARRIGKHRAWSLAMLFACAVFAVVPFIPAGAVLAFGAVCVLTGLMLGFDVTIPPSIQADVIDVDTAESGEQRSGLYFAAWSLATKLSLALGVGIVFPVLDLAGFSPGQNSAGDGSTFVLAGLYAWLPIVFKLIAIALMWRFPLNAQGQADLRARIDSGSVIGKGEPAA